MCLLPNIVKMMKSRRMRWADLPEREIRKLMRVGNLKVKYHFRKHRCRLEGSDKMMNEGVWAGLNELWGDCCEQGNEHSDITECMELFDWVGKVLTNALGRLYSVESVHFDAVWL